jgi:hypothetical protein
MKLSTIALATALALSSTFALAQQNGATGAQGGATGVPGVKTNPTPGQASEGGSTGVPGVKTEPTPGIKRRQHQVRAARQSTRELPTLQAPQRGQRQ